MKSTLFKTLAIMIGMVMSFSLVSCGDDDDNNEPEDPKAVAYYDVKYATDLEDDWFKFFDVTITYVNGAGKEVTEAIDINKDMPSVKIEAAMAPNTINFKIHVTRKASIPAVDPDQPIDFKGQATFIVQEYLKDGSKGDYYGKLFPENTHGTIIGGKDLDKFIDKYNNTDIFVRSAEIKK